MTNDVAGQVHFDLKLRQLTGSQTFTSELKQPSMSIIYAVSFLNQQTI